MKNRIIIFLFITIGLSFASQPVQVKVNQPGQLIVEVNIDSAWISQNDNIIHVEPNLATYFCPGSPIIPYWQDIFIGLPANADIKVYRNKNIEMSTYNPILSEEEKAKGTEFELPILNMFEGSFPIQDVILTSVKDINNSPTTKVEIFPFSITNNKLFYTQNISVHISWEVKNQLGSASQLSTINQPDYFQNKYLNKSFENVIPEYHFYQNIAKIVVDTSAWYNISYSELINAGVNLSESDINTFRLWNKDEEKRLMIETGNDEIFNNNDELIFFAEKNTPPQWADYDNNFYTNDNIYWLTWGTGKGLQFDNLDVEPILIGDEIYKQSFFIDEKKIEKDEIYEKINRNNQYLFQTWDVIDHFFMSPKIIVSRPFDFEFELDSPYLLDSIKFELEIQARGMTSLDHELDIYLNENLVGTSKWSDRKNNNFVIKNIDSSALIDGTNTFSVNLSPNDSTAHDLVYINWFKVKYPSRFNTKSNYLKFVSQYLGEKTTEFEITGFTNNDIYIIKDYKYKLKNFKIDWDYAITFQKSNISAGSTFEVFTKSNTLQVKSISLEEPISDILQNITNDYIIIAPDSFFSILEPLTNYHNGKIVDIEKIYRQYSYGVLSPYAIKSFLEDTYYNNGQKLKYVLLTMSADAKDFWLRTFDHIPSFIPTMFIYTYNMGVVACDYWFGSFDDEFWIPNISVGRFPINTKSELQNIVDKTMFHHNRNSMNWDNNNLLIGGSEVGFTYQSESLVNNIKDSGAFVSRLYVAQTSQDSAFFGNADTLANHFSNGFAYINFFGHGGGRVWEDNELLTYANIKNLNNKRKLPFVSSMSCHTGDISYPQILSRQMIANPNGGALAWYAASGLGWNYNDYYLTIPLQNLLFSNKELTIGEIINLSKTKYYLAYSDLYPEIAGSQLYQYNLIGDPAIKLKKSVFDATSINPLDPEPNEIINILPTQSNIDSVHYQIFQPNNYSMNNSTFIGNDSPFEFTLPDISYKGIYDINVSYKVDDQLHNSSQMFTVSGSYVDIIKTIPVIPTICDSIGVLVEVIDRNGISSIQLFVNNEYWADLEYQKNNHYILEELIPPQSVGSTLNIYCKAIDSNNDTTSSLVKSFNISEIPDISPLGGKFVVDSQINVAVDIESSTATPVEVFSELYLKQNEFWNRVGQDTIQINGREIQKAKFPGYFPIGVNEYRVITNANLSCLSSNVVSDDTLEFELETNAFWVTPELGSTDDGINHSKIGFSDIDIDIPSGVVSEPSIIQIDKINSIDLVAQPDFEILQLTNDYTGIEINWDTEEKYTLSWTLNNSLDQYSQNLYQYFENYRLWLPINFDTKDDSIATFTSTSSAKFAFLDNKDSDKPIITATINNQKYLENIYVNTDPIIQFTIYDKNGVDFREPSIEISLNNQNIEISSDDITGSGNTLNLEISPTLTELDSCISIISLDAAGNESDTLKLSFIVSNKMDIIDYGNYPNPFSDNTTFAYELTEAVDKLTFKIFSVEGRLIRKLFDEDVITGPGMNLPGYHELEWDGKNSDQNSVNNGNYFYQVKAKKNKKVVNKIGKILKVN